MVKWFNNLIPIQGYIALTFYFILFIRKKYKYLPESLKLDEVLYNHEKIHMLQHIEILVLSLILCIPIFIINNISFWYLTICIANPFILYVIGYIISKILTKRGDYITFKEYNNKVYRNNCFEREAYNNQDNLKYRSKRIPFYWITYLFTKKSWY